jgi:hypothetical protein
MPYLNRGFPMHGSCPCCTLCGSHDTAPREEKTRTQVYFCLSCDHVWEEYREARKQEVTNVTKQK